MLEDKTISDIYKHAEESFPNECCGVVTRANKVVPMDNVAEEPQRAFVMDPAKYLAYSKDALFFYHSHPRGKAVFSTADLTFQTGSQLPLMVVSWPQGEIRLCGETHDRTQLLERPFIYGVYDCYALLRDFYYREFDVQLPQMTRPRSGWWKIEGADPFTDNVRACGFKDCSDLQYGDVLLFASDGGDTAYHIGVYTGRNQFMHHPLYRLSSEEIYNERWRKATLRTLRHATRD